MNITWITNSERTAAACPQKWFLQYGCGLRPERTNRTLQAGTLFHDAVDAWFMAARDYGTTDDRSLAAGLARLHEWSLHRQMIEEKRQAGHMASDLDGWEHFNEDMATYSLVVDVFERYVATNAERMREWVVVLSEHTLAARAVTPKGRQSTRTGITGKVDRVIQLQPGGEYWLHENKLTAVNLQHYRDTYCRSAQPYTYGWLMRRDQGKALRGVIYDLALRVEHDAPDSLAPLQSGERLGKPKGLPKMTAAQFKQRVESFHGMTLEQAAALNFAKPSAKNPNPEPKLDCAWYAEVHANLLEAEANHRWFMLYTRPFAPADMPRIQSELYNHATIIRQWDDVVAADREAVNAGTMTVQEMVERHHAHFARSPGMCHSMGRLCWAHDTCTTGIVEGGLVRHATRHLELDDETTPTED